jgi:hypothetical protein
VRSSRLGGLNHGKMRRMNINKYMLTSVSGPRKKLRYVCNVRVGSSMVACISGGNWTGRGSMLVDGPLRIAGGAFGPAACFSHSDFEHGEM